MINNTSPRCRTGALLQTVCINVLTYGYETILKHWIPQLQNEYVLLSLQVKYNLYTSARNYNFSSEKNLLLLHARSINNTLQSVTLIHF